MSAPNPVLIEVTRGPLVESRHRGAVALARPDGSLRLALGDVAARVFPRSAIKAIQCLPLIESGAADAFGFEAADIALACASHSGSPAHVARAAHMLERCGCGADHLACGAHVPLGNAEAVAFHRNRDVAQRLHNNCSGKHAGMVAAARHLGEPVATYAEPDSPSQRRIAALIEALTGASATADVMGIDGCSLPNWALPLDGLAGAFAKLATGEGAARAHRSAVTRIFEACWTAPEMVAGEGRLDTTLLGHGRDRLFVKTGAEGVYCGAVPALGLGFAIKIDDGAQRGSEAALIALLDRLVPDVAAAAQRPAMRNWAGREVGTVRSSSAYLAVLDQL